MEMTAWSSPNKREIVKTVHFDNVDAAKWQRIKDQLIGKAGITITSDIGEAEAKGLDVAWKYDAIALTLDVTPISRKFWDPSEAVIDTDLVQWIGAA